MEIAPNFTSDQWFSLNLDGENEKDWQKGIDVLRDRLYARYIEPVDVLLRIEENQPPKDRKFGFTVLAIDLLLMETLQAFKEGLVDTKGKSRGVFKRFLEQSPHFAKYFHDEATREEFYTSFRCGILHQAEIQSSALVWSLGELYERAGDLEIINRNAVHQNIKADLDDYLLMLRDSVNNVARERFKTKMNAIANRAF
ncbi:MAG: hypothetical protein JAY90_22340 [Candidatus Thiodiazotropha lotti]|nr:hypothetical protein [Candidatus Thiodiazotropha lotti]